MFVLGTFNGEFSLVESFVSFSEIGANISVDNIVQMGSYFYSEQESHG